MVDYHTHTGLCGHASGTVDEYVASAVRAGMREIGVADHAPMPEGIREGLSMAPEDVEPYMAAVLGARERHGGRIAVRLGFEVDFPLFGSFDRKYFTDPRVDYLIGSCHFIDGWAFDHPRFADEWKRRDVDETYARYFALVQNMADAGLFDIVGHFDIVKKFGHRPAGDIAPAVESIARRLAARGTAVEINTAGLSHDAGEIYPSDRIIRILFDRNVPVTLGSDAHAPERIGHAFPEAVARITRAGYRTISGFERRKRYDIPL